MFCCQGGHKTPTGHRRCYTFTKRAVPAVPFFWFVHTEKPEESWPPEKLENLEKSGKKNQKHLEKPRKNLKHQANPRKN